MCLVYLRETGKKNLSIKMNEQLEKYLTSNYWNHVIRGAYHRVFLQDHDMEGSEMMDYVIIAGISLLLGLVAGMLMFYLRGKQHTHQSSQNSDQSKLQIDTSFSSTSPSQGSNKSGRGLKSALKQTSNYQSESVNTLYNLDDFMLRLYRFGFVVNRIKGNDRKLRCIKINRNGELCIYKNYEEKDVVMPSGKPYIRIDLLELRDCFRCEDNTSFILEFKSKSFHLATRIGLDTSYLVDGFKYLSLEVKADKNYITKCKARYQEYKFSRGGNDNDNASIATLGNSSTHSYISSR